MSSFAAHRGVGNRDSFSQRRRPPVVGSFTAPFGADPLLLYRRAQHLLNVPKRRLADQGAPDLGSGLATRTPLCAIIVPDEAGGLTCACTTPSSLNSRTMLHQLSALSCLRDQVDTTCLFLTVQDRLGDLGVVLRTECSTCSLHRTPPWRHRRPIPRIHQFRTVRDARKRLGSPAWWQPPEVRGNAGQRRRVFLTEPVFKWITQSGDARRMPCARAEPALQFGRTPLPTFAASIGCRIKGSSYCPGLEANEVRPCRPNGRRARASLDL